MALTLLTPSPHQPCRGCILEVDLVEDTEAQRLRGFLKVRQTRSPLRVGRKSSCFLTLSEMAGPLCSYPLPQETWESLEDSLEEGAEGGRNCLPQDLPGVGRRARFPWDHTTHVCTCPLRPRLTCGLLLSSRRRALGPLPSQGDRAQARSVQDPDSGLQFVCSPTPMCTGLRMPAHFNTAL